MPSLRAAAVPESAVQRLGGAAMASPIRNDRGRPVDTVRSIQRQGRGSPAEAAKFYPATRVSRCRASEERFPARARGHAPAAMRRSY